MSSQTGRFRFVLCACLSVSCVEVKIPRVHCTTSVTVGLHLTFYAKWLASLTFFFCEIILLIITLSKSYLIWCLHKLALYIDFKRS